MANKRNLQVAELIKRNFSIVLQQEGSYIYGDVLVTVTRVDLTPDFGTAKIYLSIYNTEDKQSVVLLMKDSLSLLRKELARRIRKQTRKVPYLEIYEDDTLDEMYRLNELFDRIKKDDEE